MRKMKIICCVWMLALFCMCGCAQTKNAEVSFETGITETDTQENMPVETEEPAVCFVYICGAVENPGVYEVPAGSRICDVTALAGGLREDAAMEEANLAEKISDEQKIRILTKEEAAGVQTESCREADSSGRINLNTATTEELMTLPGVGQSKADSILAYRMEHGGFKATDEIMNISGIKQGVFEKIKDRIMVN